MTEFVTGQPLEAAQVRGNDIPRSVPPPALRSFHATAPLTHAFDGDVSVCRTATAPPPKQGASRLPAASSGRRQSPDRIESAFAAAPEPPCPCHNDLLPANFLARPDGGLWLLDWEYAGMNDRYFDLGNFAVNNELDRAGDEALLDRLLRCRDAPPAGAASG